MPSSASSVLEAYCHVAFHTCTDKHFASLDEMCMQNDDMTMLCYRTPYSYSPPPFASSALFNPYTALICGTGELAPSAARLHLPNPSLLVPTAPFAGPASPAAALHLERRIRVMASYEIPNFSESAARVHFSGSCVWSSRIPAIAAKVSFFVGSQRPVVSLRRE